MAEDYFRRFIEARGMPEEHGLAQRECAPGCLLVHPHMDCIVGPVPPYIRQLWEENNPAPEDFTLVRARRNGKSIHYLMEQQRLLQYYHAEQVKIYDDATVFHAMPFDRDVDATFENEFRMQ